jgi:Metalloenzyme superfamily
MNMVFKKLISHLFPDGELKPGFFVGLFYFIFFLCSVISTNAQTRKTENIVIVTLDGMRWQEIFGGIDSAIMNSPIYSRDRDNLKFNFWDDDLKLRRKKLFPFLWTRILNNGQLYGNRNIGNTVNVANPYRFSYPGYNEIFTGYPDTAVNSNEKIFNKNRNVLEFINQQKEYQGKVAAFTTWNLFPYILNRPRSGFYINSDTDTLNIESGEASMINEMSRITARPLGIRPDVITFLSAKLYLQEIRPKVLFISFLETDYSGHNGMYDLYITSAHAEDAMIEDLWNTLQNMPDYKDKTTLIITCDHGRGDKIKDDWTRHGTDLNESGETWIAVIGPDSPVIGEVKNDKKLYQKQLAPTIAALLGFQFPNNGHALPINSILPN